MSEFKKQFKKPDANNELENGILPSVKIEPIIFRLAQTKTKYSLFLAKHFKSNWFNDDSLGKLTEVVLNYHHAYHKLPNDDTMFLIASKLYREDKDKLKNVEMQLKTIFSMDMNYDEEFIDKQISSYITNRGMYWSIMESIDTIQKKESMDACIERMSSILSMSFDQNRGHDYFADFPKYEEYLLNPESMMSTGYASMDTLMGGGFPKDGKFLFTILAEVHAGKSALMSNLAVKQVMQGRFAVVISLEMSEMVVSNRASAHFTKMNINKLREEVPQLKQKIKEVENKSNGGILVIKEFPSDTITVKHIDSYINELVIKYGRNPDIIFVDYIGLILPGGNVDPGNLYLKGGKVAKQLRALSYFFKCPVVTAAQLKRSAFNSTEIGMDDTAESVAIPADSDYIVALYQQEGDRELGMIRSVTLKNRLTGVIKKSVDYHIDYTNLIIDDDHLSQGPSDKIADEIMKAVSEGSIADL